MQYNYQEDKRNNWQERGADETDYQREKRQAAESKVRGFSRRISAGSMKREDAVVIVRELLRTTRSPSKRPVYEAWLERQERGTRNGKE